MREQMQLRDELLDDLSGLCRIRETDISHRKTPSIFSFFVVLLFTWVTKGKLAGDIA